MNRLSKNITGIAFFVLLTFVFVQSSWPSENRNSRFVILGCTNLSAYPPEKLGLIVEKIKEHNPDFVIFLCGLIDPMDNESVETLGMRYDKLISSLNVPVYFVSNNCHDLLLKLSEDKKQELEKYYSKKVTKHYFSIEHNNNLFVFLDSENLSLEIRNNPIAKVQLEFLNKTLAGSSRYKNVFVAMHDSPWLDNEKLFSLLHPIFKNKVKYVFGAGIKTSDLFTSKDNVNYIGVRSGSIMDLSKLTGLFDYFLVVDTANNRVSVSAIPLSFMKQNFLHPKESYKLHILNTPGRNIMLNPKEIIPLLKIRPGMDIVDIGAGTGLFTFPLADATGPSGRVFATDIDKKMVRFIAAKTKKSAQYSNVYAIQVDAQALDSFYKKHSFDIIFLCALYEEIINRKEYFRQLRNSLNQENGRLYIIQGGNTMDFTESEFPDFQETFKLLSSQKLASVLLKYMNQETLSFIKTYSNQDVPSKIRKDFINSLNIIINDRFFWNELQRKSLATNEQTEADLLDKVVSIFDNTLAQWLIHDLENKGVFNINSKTISESDTIELNKLNRILLAGILKTSTLSWLVTPRLAPSKNTIINELTSAGYEFIAENNSLPYHYFLEFKRKK